MTMSAVARRTFIGRSCLAAGALAAGPRPATGAGFFAGGSDRLRIGLVGCGGRGTGAAMQATGADSGIRIAALADLFADQLESAHAMLAAAAGPAVECPARRRFTGVEAWRRLMDLDLDAVILATSPDARPRQVTAAVASGKHVYCEAPAAVDVAGVAAVLAACRAAATAGLSCAAGLAWRHDPRTIHAIARIRAGDVGSPMAGRFTSRIGLPWRTACGSDGGAERNWISAPGRSGGDLVEHQVHAIDKALWAWGDATPVTIEPLTTLGGGTAARFLFAGGGVVESGIVRRAGGRDRIEELVCGSRGRCDLRAAGPGAGRHRRGMEAFVRSIRSAVPLAEGQVLCRSTLAAILGRDAVAGGHPLSWAAVAPAPGDWLPPRAGGAA